MNKIYFFGLIIICFMLSVFSCTIPRATTIKTSPLPETFISHESDTVSVAQINRRTFFQDHFLNQLIDTALVRNYDAQMAMEQIEIAKAYYKMSRGTLYPVMDFGIISTITKASQSNKFLNNNAVSLSSSWEMDLWGKLRSSKKAARSRLLASESGIQFIQTALVAEVSSAYYELLALDAELEIMGKNIKLQTTALDIVRIQKQAGKATDLAVQQFEAQLYSTKAQRNTIQQMIISAENYFNMLLNRFPQPISRSKSFNIQPLPGLLNVGVPFQLLKYRPDIVESGLLLEAAGFDLKAAEKAFYPTLKIQPTISLDLSSFNSNSFVLESLSSLLVPVFQQNMLKGNFAIKKSLLCQAFYNYEKVIRQGVTEVQTNMDKLVAIDQEILNRTNEVAILSNAINTANDLYAYGYANYLEVINAQKSARDAELALTNILKEKCLIIIGLYRAMGGGRN